MKKVYLCLTGLFLSCTFFVSAASARDAIRSIGIGAQIGSPTGVTAKYGLDEVNAFDAMAGFTFGNDTDFHVHTNWLRHRNDLFTVENRPIDLFYGVGVRMRILDGRGNDRFRIGPRLPAGLRYVFPNPLIEVFAELAFALDLIEDVDADLDFAIGGRYYF